MMIVLCIEPQSLTLVIKANILMKKNPRHRIYFGQVTFQTLVLESWPAVTRLLLSSQAMPVIWLWSCAFLTTQCLSGLSTDQRMIAVSRPPDATYRLLGAQATQFTLAVWKPHSLVCGLS